MLFARFSWLAALYVGGPSAVSLPDNSQVSARFLWLRMLCVRGAATASLSYNPQVICYVFIGAQTQDIHQTWQLYL